MIGQPQGLSGRGERNHRELRYQQKTDGLRSNCGRSQGFSLKLTQTGILTSLGYQSFSSSAGRLLVGRAGCKPSCRQLSMPRTQLSRRLEALIRCVRFQKINEGAKLDGLLAAARTIRGPVRARRSPAWAQGDLRNELGLTYIFISRGLKVVRFISDRALVMYLGEVVESGPVETLWADAKHPYTRALLAAMPSLDPDRCTEQAPIAGDPPNPINRGRVVASAPHPLPVCRSRVRRDRVKAHGYRQCRSHRRLPDGRSCLRSQQGSGAKKMGDVNA